MLVGHFLLVLICNSNKRSAVMFDFKRSYITHTSFFLVFLMQYHKKKKPTHIWSLVVFTHFSNRARVFAFLI